MPEKKKYFRIDLRVDEETFKLVEKLSSDTGLTQREILSYSSKPCTPCGEKEIMVFNHRERKTVAIPVGILFNSLKMKHSVYDNKKG